MASIIKKPNSRFWFAAFRDLNGKQRRKSTFETDRKKALKIAQQYEQVATRELPARSVRETISSLYREFYNKEIPVASVRQFTTNWLKAKESEVAPGTMDRYRESTKKLLEFLGDLADHAEAVQFGTPIASLKFGQYFRLPYRLKGFGGTIREVQSFSLQR
jgi:hypothetical protein